MSIANPKTRLTTNLRFLQGVRKIVSVCRRPPDSESTEHFSLLDMVAESSGNGDSSNALRKSRTASFGANAERSTKQTDVRANIPKLVSCAVENSTQPVNNR